MKSSSRIALGIAAALVLLTCLAVAWDLMRDAPLCTEFNCQSFRVGATGLFGDFRFTPGQTMVIAFGIFAAGALASLALWPSKRWTCAGVGLLEVGIVIALTLAPSASAPVNSRCSMRQVPSPSPAPVPPGASVPESPSASVPQPPFTCITWPGSLAYRVEARSLYVVIGLLALGLGLVLDKRAASRRAAGQAPLPVGSVLAILALMLVGLLAGAILGAVLGAMTGNIATHGGKTCSDLDCLAWPVDGLLIGALVGATGAGILAARVVRSKIDGRSR